MGSLWGLLGDLVGESDDDVDAPRNVREGDRALALLPESVEGSHRQLENPDLSMRV